VRLLDAGAGRVRRSDVTGPGMILTRYVEGGRTMGQLAGLDLDLLPVLLRNPRQSSEAVPELGSRTRVVSRAAFLA
jgi:hypothetical protein